MTTFDEKGLGRRKASTPWLALALIGISSAHAQDEDGPAFSLSAAYTGDLRRNTTGGLDVGNAYADALDLGAVWVTDGLFSGARMTTNVSVMYLGGRGITEDRKSTRLNSSHPSISYAVFC